MKWLLYLGAIGGGFLWYEGLEADRQETVRKLIDIGIVSGMICVPLGLWAVSRWPESHWQAAAVMTAAGFATKQVMLTAGSNVVERHELPSRGDPQLPSWVPVEGSA